MQRTNLWTSPNFTKTVFWGSAKRVITDGVMTITHAGGNSYAATTYQTLDSQLTFSIEVKGSGIVQVYTSDWKYVTSSDYFKDLSDWTVKTIAIPPQPGKTFIIAFYPVEDTSKTMSVRYPLLELSSTYDNAVGGGASRLLHRKHDATLIGAAIGRVMPDDADEPDHKSESDRHVTGQQVGVPDNDQENGRHNILGQLLGRRFGRLHKNEWHHHRLKPTILLHADRHGNEPYERDVHRRVRQPDSQSAQYNLLHAGRIPGEQDADRPAVLVRRRHDAIGLTLGLGVAA